MLPVAHLDIVRNEEIKCFARLGVITNCTPVWRCGAYISGQLQEVMETLGEERAKTIFKCGTMWKEGTLVTFPNDAIVFDVFSDFNLFIGMEVEILRKGIDYAPAEGDYDSLAALPSESERMTIEQMPIFLF